MPKNKKITFMLAVTSDYVFAAGNVVLALILHRPQKDFDVTIFYDDMTRAEKKIFLNTGICNLIKYKTPSGFARKIKKLCPKFTDKSFAKHFSFLKFAKFEIFNLLEQYENAVWLDADISVQDDLMDILSFGPFAITADTPWPVQNNFTVPIPGYDMDRDGVCSAVFMVSRNLPGWNKMRKWMYAKAVECAPYFKNIDQGIFNLLLQEFKIDYKLLPLYEWQCIANHPVAIDARIAHFGTKRKIWNTPELVSAFPEWWRVHKKWMALGGRDFITPDNWYVKNAFCIIDGQKKRIAQLEDELSQSSKHSD